MKQKQKKKSSKAKMQKRLEEFALAYIKNEFRLYETAEEFNVCYRTALRYSQDPEFQKILNAEIEKMKNEKIAGAQEVMEYLTSVMRGEFKEEVPIAVGIGEGMSEVTIVNKELSPKDRTKAAELLGKAYGIYTQNLDVNSNVQVVFENEQNLED